MRALLFILSVVAALLGGATLVYATTVTHEILSGVFFVIASILSSAQPSSMPHPITGAHEEKPTAHCHVI